MNIASIRKSVTPALLGVVGVVVAWVATGEFDVLELRIAAAALLTSGAVYVVPNLATSPFLKALVPAFLGLFAVLAAALERGELSVVDLRTALAALLTAGVVFLVPNSPAL